LRNRLLITIALVVLAFYLLIAGAAYYRATYRASTESVVSQLTVALTAEDHAAPSLPPEAGLMMLCPSKAREMGLCNMDDRQLHAKYTFTVTPPPIAQNPAFTCKVMQLPEPKPPKELAFPTEILIPTIDKTSDFTCSVRRMPQEGKFELDLAFIADPDDEQLIRHYMLRVIVEYDEPSLAPWIPLVTRTAARGTGVGDLYLLGYNMGKHPPPDMARGESPLAGFRSCEEGVSWQRWVLGICLEPSCQITFCQMSQISISSYVTVHVVDLKGKPIQNVTVALNGTLCCYMKGTLDCMGHHAAQVSDSGGNARFDVVPYMRYGVMIGDVIFSEITGPPPTVSTTITAILASD
jgi:hypothetical protein